MDEREKQAALEEEQARLKALKVHFSSSALVRFAYYPTGFNLFWLFSVLGYFFLAHKLLS